MKIGIATCREKPNLSAGDRNLAAVLEKKGFQIAPLIWDAPNVLAENWDAIIIRSTWDYHLYSEQFLNWLSLVEQSSIQLLNPLEVIKWNFQKSYLLEIERQGLAIVPSIVIKQDLPNSKMLEEIKKTGWQNLVLKPTLSASAFLTFKVSASSAELPNDIDQIKKHSDIVVQPFIASIETDGEASLIFFKDQTIQYSHAVLKQPKAGDFRVQADFGGAVSVLQPSSELINFAAACVEAIPRDWTFVRVDIVDWKQKPLLSELELIEPELYLNSNPSAAERFAKIIAEKIQR